MGEYHSLLAGLTGAPRLLAAVSWWSAARVGDVRRVGPENLQLDLKTDAATVHARILYTEGKGAHFWGPYTVHFTLPKSEAVALAEYARNKTGEKYLFSLKDRSNARRTWMSCGRSWQTRGRRRIAEFKPVYKIDIDVDINIYIK